MGRHLVTWIHLSDLHMRVGDEFNRSIVLSSLLRDIETLRDQQGLQADFAAFTGDAAFHGLEEEYGLAASEFFNPLLKAANLTREHLFLVPGNHDVERKKTSLLNNPLASETPKDIHELVQSPSERQILLSPLTNYQSFVRSVGGSSSFAKKSTFGYRSVIDIRRFPVTIVGLNSTWLSGFNLNGRGEVDDVRHLAVSELQLRTCTLGDSRLMIVLMHHPPDWLMETEQQLVERLLANRRAIFLRGHLHRPDVLSMSNLDGAFVSIPAGAVFERRKSPNAYNVVQVDLDTGMGTVFFRRYNDRRMEWQKDIESTGEGFDGRLSFVLPTHRSKGPIIVYPFRKPISVKATDCKFTDRCLRDLRSLRLSRASVRSLVETELESHPSYSHSDLREFPLQLQSEYLVFINRIGNRVEFLHIVSSTRNHKQLAAWVAIVSQYRILTSMSYRENPSVFALSRMSALRACELHEQLGILMKKYYAAFEHVGAPNSNARRSISLHSKAAGIDSVNVCFHLDASSASCSEVRRIVGLVDSGDIEPGTAVALLIAPLEQSLQHLHKLLSLYPPEDRRTNRIPGRKP